VDIVHCLDRLPEPHEEFYTAQTRANPHYGGSLHYHPLDVRDRDSTNQIMSAIADGKNRLDGLVAAAGVNHVESAINHSAADIERIISINYTGAFTSATAAATQMLNKQCQGSILLVSSMSGMIANKGMKSSIYNSSKAAVIQLARSFAMEWSNIDREGRGGIRVNCLCPGHIVTPMAKMVMDKTPGTKEIWESENMLGRLARPEEFRGIALLLMSNAGSFMTGSTIVADGGHTAW
jgi:NAD(P)-dependent dehydrogenase (short-subunit alcohol dehydrogenase family)